MAKAKTTQPDQTPEAGVQVNEQAVQEAVAIGKQAIEEGKTKADAVRLMYPLIADQPREVIWKAFVEGAGLTEKGAVTYLYNVKHKKPRTRTRTKPVATNEAPNTAE